MRKIGTVFIVKSFEKYNEVKNEINRNTALLLRNTEKRPPNYGYVFNVGLPKKESDYFLATEQIIKDKPDYLKYLKEVKWAITIKTLKEKLLTTLGYTLQDW
jgi:hypothetical protein